MFSELFGGNCSALPFSSRNEAKSSENRLSKSQLHLWWLAVWPNAPSLKFCISVLLERTNS